MSQKNELGESIIFSKGEKADPCYFVGDAWSKVLVGSENEFNCPIWNVTFAPNARNNWHKHPGGQILLVTGGRGWYQEEGKPAQNLKEGDIVQIPINVKHWHGAMSDSWFTHLAICTNPENGGAEWLEAVTEIEYSQLK